MSASNGTSKKKHTVLIVDDEADIRKLVGATVQRQGYTVLTADSGEHAMKLFEKHGPIDLLLTDVVAPGMSGPMLADKLAELQPGLRVLYMSGYDNTQVVQRYVIERGHALLHKPFTVEQLTRKIEEMMEERRA
jgi:two-component system, cell cycle sensor histidine kinase and response regulator CckA